MITYEAENVVLKMTDKTYKNISANYDDVIGRMAAPTLNCHISVADQDCWIKGVNTISYEENKKAAKRVWERFCDSIFDFEI